MLSGINHITIAVSNLGKSFDFYVSTLGMKPEVRWDAGAYLSAGDLWVCLSLDAASPSSDYSHIAFDIPTSNFKEYQSGLVAAGIKEWKQNTSQGQSFYILDPDGHKLEIHSGKLQDRLNALRLKPYRNLEWY
jgi:catechol 2,3-dioxygenase-like lactoylglutathione lyase family enzyme